MGVGGLVGQGVRIVLLPPPPPLLLLLLLLLLQDFVLLTGWAEGGEGEITMVSFLM